MSAECIRTLIYETPAFLALYQAGDQDAALLQLLNATTGNYVVKVTHQSSYTGAPMQPGFVTNQSMFHDFTILYPTPPERAEELTGDFNAKLQQTLENKPPIPAPPADPDNPTDPEKQAQQAYRDWANVASYQNRFDSAQGLDFASDQIQNWLVEMFGQAGASEPYRNLGFTVQSAAQGHCGVDATQQHLDQSRGIDYQRKQETVSANAHSKYTQRWQEALTNKTQWDEATSKTQWATAFDDAWREYTPGL